MKVIGVFESWDDDDCSYRLLFDFEHNQRNGSVAITIDATFEGTRDRLRDSSDVTFAASMTALDVARKRLLDRTNQSLSEKIQAAYKREQKR